MANRSTATSNSNKKKKKFRSSSHMTLSTQISTLNCIFFKWNELALEIE